MEDLNVRGLLGSAANAIARMPQAPKALERLRNAESPEEFRDFLSDANLGMAEPAEERFIEVVTGDDWQRYKDDLAFATDHAIANRFSPNA